MTEKQIIESLYGKYSVKRYNLPDHIFEIVKRRHKRHKMHLEDPAPYHLAATQLFKRFSQYYRLTGNNFVQIPTNFSNSNKEYVTIFRPKRSTKLKPDVFLVGYMKNMYDPFTDPYLMDEISIIRIPHELQFIICLKAEPKK